MTLKKQTFAEDEIAMYDDAIVYKRGDYWHFRMWLRSEGKYARKSLSTRSRSTAIDKGKDWYLELLTNQKSGKKYFSLTTKEGVEKRQSWEDFDSTTKGSKEAARAQWSREPYFVGPTMDKTNRVNGLGRQGLGRTGRAEGHIEAAEGAEECAEKADAYGGTEPVIATAMMQGLAIRQ